MAELAIPAVLLGGLYVMANQKKGVVPANAPLGGVEGMAMQKLLQKSPSAPQKSPSAPQKLPMRLKREAVDPLQCSGTLSNCMTSNINEYDGEYDSRSQFHSKRLYADGVSTNAVGSTKLTGESITEDNFKHNNMVPFFGAQVRGVQPDANAHEGVLDRMQGAGSLQTKKQETASFFKNQEGFSNIHGSPNHNDFYMQRMTSSMRMDKTLPFEPERVSAVSGGGGKSAEADGALGSLGNAGYNAGMRDREQWMPRTVDQMRGNANQKASELAFSRMGGPVNQPIKNLGQHGRVEKHGPDAHFELTPEMWSAGVNSSMLAPTHRNQPGEKGRHLLDKSFDNGTQLIYGSAQVKNAYDTRNYAPSKRTTGLVADAPEKQGLQVTRARPRNASEHDGHIYAGVTHKSTYRAEAYDRNADSTFLGAVNGAFRALVSPVVHVIKPTHKEDVLMRHRELGNYKQQIQNPEARDFEVMQPPTNREILEGKLGLSHVQMQTQSMLTHPSRDKNYSLGTLREANQRAHVGGATGSQASGAADNHHLNNYQEPIDKTIEYKHGPLGNANVWNPTINARIEKQHGLPEKPRFEAGLGHIATPSVHQIGVMNSLDPLVERSTVNDRLDGAILKAFKENPFTHSLHSVV
jgi:hypothetical protein